MRVWLSLCIRILEAINMPSGKLAQDMLSPEAIAENIYKARSVTNDGKSVDLYMELLTPSNINAWNTYREEAPRIANQLAETRCHPGSSKWRALNSVYSGSGAKTFCEANMLSTH